MSEQLRPQETQPTPEQLLQAGSEFLQHFGVKVSPTEQPEQFLEAMAQLDPRYQGGRELVRWQLEADQTEWDEETKGVIMRAAESMRMLEPETPLQGNFDVVIALGGARQANLDRTRYAVEAAKEGKVDFKYLVVAGSSRELNEAEQENAANYAPGAKTEFDLCVGATSTVAKENPGLVASVMYVEDKRAGTPAVIEKALATMKANGSLKDGARVAAVTTQIYQASTELDLDRVAKQFGVAETFTAGNPSDPNVVAKRTPATYLSEVLRTLKAASNSSSAEHAEKVAAEQAREQAEREHQELLAKRREERTPMYREKGYSEKDFGLLDEYDDGTLAAIHERGDKVVAPGIFEDSEGNIRHEDEDGGTWYSYKDGKSYSDRWGWNNDVYTIE